MVEEDYDYRPPNELFTPNRTWNGGTVFCGTRQEWACRVRDGNIKLPPPNWWLEEQDSKGRANAKFAIWHRRYSYGRQLSIWLMAPLDDFRAAKFLQPESNFARYR